MLPILLSLGPLKIYSYGLMLAGGLFLGLYFWWKMGRDEHFEEIELFDSFFISLIIFGIVGRIGYVLLHFDQVGTLYRALAFLTFPGINVLSGLIGATIFVVMFARSQNWHEWKVLDSFAVVLSAVIAFSGIGGLLNGSIPGRAASWGLMYPGQDVARIPVDIWVFVWGVITFAVVSRVRKNFRFYGWYKGESSMAQEGLASLVFLAASGIYYFVAGFLLEPGWKLVGIPGQVLFGLVLTVTAVILIERRVGRRETTIWGKLMNIIRRK